jgi:hypothetical protein
MADITIDPSSYGRALTEREILSSRLQRPILKMGGGGINRIQKKKTDLLLSIPNVLTLLQRMIFGLDSSSTKVQQILSPTLCRRLITGVLYSARKTTGSTSRLKSTCRFLGH